MSRLKKMAYPVENNEFIYVPQRAINLLHRKCIITNQYTVGGAGGKLVIEYESKNGDSHGVMELYDMGPDKPKDKKKN